MWPGRPLRLAGAGAAQGVGHGSAAAPANRRRASWKTNARSIGWCTLGLRCL